MKGRQQSVFNTEGRVIGFGKKEFKTGTNFTVRLGDNWAKERDIQLGDYVSIVSQSKDEFYFQARITHVMTCNLIDVPSSIVKGNHQADMRDGIGLVMGLQGYYEKTLVAVDRVTCLGFEAVKLEAKAAPVRKDRGDKLSFAASVGMEAPAVKRTDPTRIYDNA